MKFEITTNVDLSLNAKIESHIVDRLDQITSTHHVFQSGAIYVHHDSEFIAGAIFKIQGTSLWIDSLWVSKEFQNQGIGTQLIDQLSTHGKQQMCKFLQLNTYFAQPFFQKVGFEVVAIIPQWKFGLDCCFMRKAL